jgi:hypothetical protein
MKMMRMVGKYVFGRRQYVGSFKVGHTITASMWTE